MLGRVETLQSLQPSPLVYRNVSEVLRSLGQSKAGGSLRAFSGAAVLEYLGCGLAGLRTRRFVFRHGLLLADLLASVQTRAVSFYRKLHRCKSVPRLPSGRETLRGPGAPSLGASAIDFWRWAFADLKQNALRGVFAELRSPGKSP